MRVPPAVTLLRGKKRSYEVTIAALQGCCGANPHFPACAFEAECDRRYVKRCDEWKLKKVHQPVGQPVRPTLEQKYANTIPVLRIRDTLRTIRELREATSY